MAPRKKAKRKPRRRYTDGALFQFHGAYKLKADAEKKARKVKGFYKRTATKASGDWRYVVMANRDGSVPF
jgi:hypothetical protein